MKRMIIILAVTVMSLTGCKTPEPLEPVIETDEAMVFLEPGLRPEILLFPDYLLTEDFQLNQHGAVPQSDLVGAGMQTELSFKKALNQIRDILEAKGWTTDQVELGKKSFRVMATKQQEFIELRGVQGETLTQVFVLYRPEPIADSIKRL